MKWADNSIDTKQGLLGEKHNWVSKYVQQMCTNYLFIISGETMADSKFFEMLPKNAYWNAWKIKVKKPITAQNVPAVGNVFSFNKKRKWEEKMYIF